MDRALEKGKLQPQCCTPSYRWLMPSPGLLLYRNIQRCKERDIFSLFLRSHSIPHPRLNAKPPYGAWRKCWEKARRVWVGGGVANTDECIHSDYTVMDETIATVNTSRQCSMQLSSPPQCSFIQPGLPRRNFCLTGAAQPGNHASLCGVAPFMICRVGAVISNQLEMSMNIDYYRPQHFHTLAWLNF